jgi:hypothetical protein
VWHEPAGEHIPGYFVVGKQLATRSGDTALIRPAIENLTWRCVAA